jgi:predicted metalloprotease
MSRLLGAAIIAASTVLMVSGCTNVLEGKPVSMLDDPFHVAGLAATDGPTGLRPDATGPTREVENGDGGEDDEIAAKSVSDIEEFWYSAYHEPLKGSFKPVKYLISWDADGYNGQFCGVGTVGLEKAAFCPRDDSIGWDRGKLLPDLRSSFGEMAVTMVLAREYGHSVQDQAKLTGSDIPTLVSEQQADCFAGMYMRWVAEGSSPRFTLSTGGGLNNLLAAMLSLRDPVPDYGTGNDEHGSAFERITAFQFGFTDGVSSCAAIDIKEIGQRRGDLPVELPENQTGELPVSVAKGIP